MLVSLKADLAYLAMTKTASTAVENALRPRCEIVFSGTAKLTHMTARRFARFVRPYLNVIGAEDVQTTCLFRHPVSWLASWYQYSSRPGRQSPDLNTESMSFDEFVMAYVGGESPVQGAIGRPWEFVRGQDGELGIDHVFRYEDMDLFLAFLTSRFGTEIELGRHNVSPVRTIALSTSVMRVLEEFFDKEFDLYDMISRR